MIKEVTGDDIQIGGEWYHPILGSTNKAEAQKNAEHIRKSTGLKVRVLHRERNIKYFMKNYTSRRGGPGYAPFKGWVVYRGEREGSR